MNFLMNQIVLLIFFASTLVGQDLIVRNDVYEMTQVTPIELAAVGRVAELGGLYDARTDRFLHLSIFNSLLPSSTITTTQNRQTKLKYLFANTFEEKFNSLDISANLKLSVLGGLFQLEGTGKFFKDTKTSAKSGKASLVNSISTEYEQISLTQDNIQKLINHDALSQIDATHVVVGIQWGGNLFISVEDMNREEKDHQTVQGSLMAKLTMLAAQISGQAQVNINEKERKELSQFNFEIFGDILPEEVPQTLIDAVKFMKNATRLLQSANNGKGKAMKYSLIPISLLRKLLKITGMVNSILNRVDEATVQNCVKLFDNINAQEQKLNDLVVDVNKFEKQILTKEVDEINKLQFDFKIYQAQVQRNLSESLIQVRSGKETVSKLENVLDQASKHPSSWQQLKLKDFTKMNKKLSFLKMMAKMNVTFLDKDKPLEIFLSDHYENDIYMLFYQDEFSATVDKSMETFRHMIRNKTSYGQSAIFACLKMDLFGLTYKPRLSFYRNMKLMIENFEQGSKTPDNNNPETWSIHFMRIQLAKLMKESVPKKDIDEYKNSIKKLESNPVPIGFIYVQLSGQSDPKTLWPNTNWKNVSPNYSGLFFRAEGGQSKPFGQIQEQQTQSIQIYNEWTLHLNDISMKNWITITDKPLTKFIETGKFSDDDNHFGINVKHNNEDIHPRNQAIRIWQRI